jgi:hypothetical protein
MNSSDESNIFLRENFEEDWLLISDESASSSSSSSSRSVPVAVASASDFNDANSRVDRTTALPDLPTQPQLSPTQFSLLQEEQDRALALQLQRSNSERQERPERESESESESERDVSASSSGGASSSSSPTANVNNEMSEVWVVPFKVTASYASELFAEWRRSRWLTPGDFEDVVGVKQLEPRFLPFYLWRVPARTEYRARAAFNGPRRTTTSVRLGGHHGIETGVSSSSQTSYTMVSGAVERTFVDVVTPALDESGEMRVVVRKLGRFRFGDRRHVLTPAANLIVPHMEPARTWTRVRAYVDRKLQAACRREAIELHAADSLSHLSLSTTVASCDVELVYAPIWQCIFYHGGADNAEHRYGFWVNGVTGDVYGKRPYGVGSLLASVRSIGTALSTDRMPRIVDGLTLAAEEDCVHYDAKHSYIDFASSSASLFGRATGHIVLANVDPLHSVELVSQRRGRPEFGGSTVLPPSSEFSFDYKGSWLIMIRVPEPPSRARNMVRIRSVTISGRGPSGPQQLAMTSKRVSTLQRSPSHSPPILVSFRD